MDPRNARHAPRGITLYDDDERRIHGTSIGDAIDSMASPAVYYQEHLHLHDPPPPFRYHGDGKKATAAYSVHSSAFTPSYPGGHGSHAPFHDGALTEHYQVDGHGGRFAFVRNTNFQIIASVVLGVALGALLSYCEASTDASNLVKLPGQIFLRVLKCFVIPMVFCSLSTSVANIVVLGKVSTVGTRTALYFMLFSSVATAISFAISMMLRSLHQPAIHDALPPPRAFLSIGCRAEHLLQQQHNHSRPVCLSSSAAQNGSALFELIDPTHGIIDTSLLTTVTVTQQVTQILHSLFPTSIFQSFNDGVLLSVIMFSIAFGAASINAARPSSASASGLPRSPRLETTPLLEVLQQLNQIIFLVITKIITWSPLAVLSLVAGSLSSQTSLTDALHHVGVLLLSNLLSVLLLHVVFYPAVLWCITKRSPLSYMRAMLPCVYFAFGSASSLATLPVTLRCVEASRRVSRSLSHFVITIGSTSHMNGTAMLFPNAVVFLVSTAPTAISIGWLQCFLIMLISMLSSIGVAPIPNAGLVMVYSVWATIFPDQAVPASFSYLIAIHWYMDRVNTACNVLGDTYVSLILASQVNESADADADADANADDGHVLSTGINTTRRGVKR